METQSTIQNQAGSVVSQKKVLVDEDLGDLQDSGRSHQKRLRLSP